MNRKKLTKWLKGSSAGRVVGYIMLIPAIALMLIGAIVSIDASDLEPVRYDHSLQSKTYCYMDVQYMTELYAALEEDGIETAQYCFAADVDFNWVCIELKNKDYEAFSDIVDFTYDADATTAPRTIRLVGSLYHMESELEELSEEYFEDYVAYDESDVFSTLYVKFGANDEMSSGLTTLGLGGITGAVAALLMFTGSKRRKAAKKSMASLAASNQTDLAIADLQSPETIRFEVASEKSGGNALGDKFAFVFTSGRILRYDEIASLSLTAVRNDIVASLRTLNLHDADGKSFPLVSESIAMAGKPDCVIDRLIAHIQQRNPDCKML